MDKVNFGDRSDNCLKEFRHAGNQRADRTVVAALETTMTKAATKWTGSFQLALARQTPVNLVKLSDDAVERLANAIRMRIDTPKASSDLTPLMRDIYPRLSPFSSEVWAKGKAVKFTVGTRSWILDSLCNWHRRNRSAVFILAGDGGVGKSVVMAELCFRGGALQIDEHMEGFKSNLSTKPFRKLSLVRSLWRRSKRERSPIFVAAYHFFRHDQVTAAAPKEALVSIAWQLCQSVPGFAEMLDTMNIEDVRDKALPDMFQIILIDPLSKLGPDMARQVVVIDALDECSKSDELLQNVVRKWKDSMPPWLNLVMSTRLEGEIERIITNNNLDYKVLELKDAENLRDIELHIKHLLREMSDVVQAKNLAECAKILSKRSDGLFLWAGFLPNALKQAHRKKHHGPLTMQDILEEDVIPAGLGGMFEEYFERLLVKVGGDDVYKALMAPLVAAREPLSVEHLSSLLGKSKQKTAAIVNDARNLLHKGGDGRVALIHKRMADWLSDSEQSGARLCVDLDKGHERLAEYCGVHDDAFAFRHAVFHCIKSGNSRSAFGLLNDFGWVHRAISFGNDEAQRRVTIRNLIRDCVELGINFARESDTPRFLSKAIIALSHDPNELASQVLARLGHGSRNPLARSLIRPKGSWLEPVGATLPRSRDPLQQVLRGQYDDVWCVAIQGDTIVSGSGDCAVRIWNAASGEEQQVLKGHYDRVTSVAIEGNTVVSGSKDKSIRIWNARTGEQLSWKYVASAIESVTIQGDLIVSGFADGMVYIWDCTSDCARSSLRGHSDRVTSVAIDGNTIVSGSYDKTVRIWNATKTRLERVLRRHSGFIYCVAIQGNTIVSGSFDNTVRIWNALSGHERHILRGHSSRVSSVAILGNSIVSGSWDKSVRVWSANTGDVKHVLRGHSGFVTSLAVDGDTIVSGALDRTVQIWNVESGAAQDNHKKHASAVTVVAIRGNIVVSGSDDMTVRIWNARTGKQKRVLKGHTGPITSLAVQGNIVLSGSSDWTIALSLYRDCLRMARCFYWADDNGEPWSVVLKRSARKEFEEARNETDPIIIARMLVVGRQCVEDMKRKFNETEDAIRKRIDRTRNH
ncbi:WD repeat-containing protein pop2 [Hondaea fermentalgiana]|uniref:WD repeat-containing protein pop2 n=1 Tax=Hondaea fermentalgiana TaxID=2315210 RepID=A0A2R5G3Q8_9STRA|nr:WD repeat-containing protein pop2 [Hondaea fermentalgiana]|eukprot:GBG25650.1 WD repeat-containing protein pop2 [Hondaea fermentalgiana]